MNQEHHSPTASHRTGKVSGRVVLFTTALVLSLVSAPAGQPLANAGGDAPQLFLDRIDREGSSVALSWSNSVSTWAYTVESADALKGPAGWGPVPASVFPVPQGSWTDPRLASGNSRFYRLTASPAQADRGKLIAAVELPLLSSAEVRALFAGIGLPIPVGGAVRSVKLTYETINPFELRTTGSGLLVLPQNPAKPLPLVSYQHGTIVNRAEVPSALQGLERVVGVALGTGGYIAALPDYVGLGDSAGLHPFVHAKSEAAAAVDMLRAAQSFCRSNGIALNDQLFLMGYSEGGHATMALHRELETFHTNEFTITASAPMAGPYDLSGVMVADFLSDRAMPNPYYFLYLVAAYQSIYHVADSLADILASPYDQTLPPLLDGRHDGSVLNDAIGLAKPARILKPEFLAAFKNDPKHPLRLALQENDLFDWTPRAPMRLYHCDGDQDVLFQNTQVAYQSFISRGATQVELVNPYPSADHGRCAPIALLAAKIWFDTLVK